MQVIPTSIPDVLIFEPRVFGDGRGYFFESFRADVFREHVSDLTFVQDNESYSRYGVLRGLHYQNAPHTQGKLVRAVRGTVLDVAVDIRKGSPTRGKHVAEVLSEENRRSLWVPPGFAHGFVVLSDTALFSYKCTDYYFPSGESGIFWNDPQLGIDWKIPYEDILVSEKDGRQPLFSDSEGLEAN